MITAPAAMIASVDVDIAVHVHIRIPMYVNVAVYVDIGMRSAAISLGGER
jgi:hypothetical protein